MMNLLVLTGLTTNSIHTVTGGDLVSGVINLPEKSKEMQVYNSDEKLAS